MEILILILPVALIISIGFVICFISAVLNGQYDDLETPSHRILLDEENIEYKNVNRD
jgi:cbb3-type cytochrome oxidase maturation protein